MEIVVVAQCIMFMCADDGWLEMALGTWNARPHLLRFVFLIYLRSSLSGFVSHHHRTLYNNVHQSVITTWTGHLRSRIRILARGCDLRPIGQKDCKRRWKWNERRPSMEVHTTMGRFDING